MKRNGLFACVILVVIALLLSGACAPQAPATTTAPTSKSATSSTPATKPSPAAGTIELKFATWSGPLPNTFSAAMDWFNSEIEKRSNGRIKVTRYWTESLVTRLETPEGLASGIADMAASLPAHYPAKLPLSTIGSAYGYFTTDLWPASKAYADLYKEMPVMRNELTKYKSRYMTTAGASPYYVMTKKPVTKMADLKGLKIRALEFEAKALQAIGAVPVNLGAPEVLEAVQRGTLDGVAFAVSAMGSYGIFEVAKYVYRLPLSGQTYLFLISDKAWNSVPKDLQDMMLKTADEHHDAFYRIYVQQGDTTWIDKMKAAGVTFTDPSKEDLAQFQKLTSETILDEWVKDKVSKGLPGKEVMDKFASLIKKYEPMNPFKK